MKMNNPHVGRSLPITASKITKMNQTITVTERIDEFIPTVDNNNNNNNYNNDNNNKNNNNISALGALKQSLSALTVMQIKESD